MVVSGYTELDFFSPSLSFILTGSGSLGWVLSITLLLDSKLEAWEISKSELQTVHSLLSQVFIVHKCYEDGLNSKWTALSFHVDSSIL